MLHRLWIHTHAHCEHGNSLILFVTAVCSLSCTTLPGLRKWCFRRNRELLLLELVAIIFLFIFLHIKYEAMHKTSDMPQSLFLIIAARCRLKAFFGVLLFLRCFSFLDTFDCI